MCAGHVDGVTIYRPQDRPSHDETLGRWTYATAVTKSGDATLTPDPQSLMIPDAEYVIYSWSRDANASAYGTVFTPAQLSDLSPGEVLSSDWRSESHFVAGAVLSDTAFADSVTAYCERN
jgi:hypothetical protein